MNSSYAGVKVSSSQGHKKDQRPFLAVYIESLEDEISVTQTQTNPHLLVGVETTCLLVKTSF